MTILDDIAAAVLPVAAEFSVDGLTEWTVWRPDATTRVPAVVGTVAGAIIQNKNDAQRLALAQMLGVPQQTVYSAPWSFTGVLGQDLQVEDVLVAGDRAFSVVGPIQTDLAMLIAPLAPSQDPA